MGYKHLLSGASLEDEAVILMLQNLCSEIEAEISSTKSTNCFPSSMHVLLLLLQTRLRLHKMYQALGTWTHETILYYSKLIKQRVDNAETSKTTEEKEAAILQLNKKNECVNSCLEIKQTAVSAATKISELLQLLTAHSDQQTINDDSSSCSETCFYTNILFPPGKGSTAAAAADSNKEAITTVGGAEVAAFAFNSVIVKLQQVGPIRRVPLRNYSDNLEYIRNICDEMSTVCESALPLFTTATADSVSALVSIVAMKCSNSKLCDGNDNASLTLDDVLHTSLHLSSACLHLLPRCLYCAVLHVLSPDICSLLWASMHAKGLPAALLESDLLRKQWLPGNPATAVWDTLKALVVCRSRLLSSRMENVIALWGHVAGEALYVDEKFREDCGIGGDQQATATATAAAQQQQQPMQWCSLWALLLTVQMMDLYMGLVVEMNLLQPSEWDYFYWYWDYICSTASYTVDRMRSQKYQLESLLYEEEKSAAACSSNSSNKKKKKSKDNQKSISTSTTATPTTTISRQPVLQELTIEEQFIKGRGQLCRGVYRMCMLAEALGGIDKRETKYTTWNTKFSRRFNIFASLTNPPALSYSDFERATARTIAVTAASDINNTQKVNSTEQRPPAIELSNIVSGASQCFQQARKIFDDARKVIITNSSGADISHNKYVQDSIVALTKVMTMLFEYFIQYNL